VCNHGGRKLSSDVIDSASTKYYALCGKSRIGQAISLFKIRYLGRYLSESFSQIMYGSAMETQFDNYNYSIIVHSQPPVIDGTAHFYPNQDLATNERRNQIKPVTIF
jgi:hypothetical protein